MMREMFSIPEGNDEEACKWFMDRFDLEYTILTGGATFSTIIAKDGETLHGISQMYGIRLKNLCSINRRSRDSQVSAGQQIRLM